MWVLDIFVKVKIMFLGDNIKEYLHDLGVVKDFFKNKTKTHTNYKERLKTSTTLKLPSVYEQ